jgi:hypothetical protein
MASGMVSMAAYQNRILTQFTSRFKRKMENAKDREKTSKTNRRNFGATIRLSMDEYGCVRLHGMTESCWVWLRIAEYN